MICCSDSCCSGTDSWCGEHAWCKPSEDGGLKYCGGWLGNNVGRSVGICRVEGVSARKCATRDCAQNSSSKHMLGGMANCVEFIMASEETALEHREIDNVALELKRVDDGESSKRQGLESGWWQT